MGNHRLALNSETLGVKVIGIGVPTVVDAVTIVNDTMENFIVALESSELLKSVGGDAAQLQRGREAGTDPGADRSASERDVYDTKNIDDTIKRVSFTISEA